MKKIVIDSNIVFAALRSKSSFTRNIILTSKDQYFCPNFLIVEIFKHKDRIVQKSKLNEEETLELLMKILEKITFINETNISIANFIEAFHLCKDVDEKDTPFVALSLELGFELWTRDQELINGLKVKGFDQFHNENA